jgi:hypothetical protein
MHEIRGQMIPWQMYLKKADSVSMPTLQNRTPGIKALQNMPLIAWSKFTQSCKFNATRVYASDRAAAAHVLWRRCLCRRVTCKPVLCIPSRVLPPGRDQPDCPPAAGTGCALLRAFNGNPRT